MPTHKQIAKTKTDYIEKKNASITTDITKISDGFLNDILANLGDYKNTGKLSQRAMQKVLRDTFKDNFPKVMRDTANAGKSLGDLNVMYFSTLVDSGRLDEVKKSSDKAIDRGLGLNEDGTIKENGFLDKALRTEKLQQSFQKELVNALKGNPDIGMLKDRIEKFIVGNDVQSGFLQKHYNTLAKDILIQIDRKNANIFASELDLRHFIFGGALLKTSRCFCLNRKGKIFDTTQADGWKNMLGQACGPVWDEERDGEYIPTEHMGGIGCVDTADWITSDIANSMKAENNQRATTRNANFKEKHID